MSQNLKSTVKQRFNRAATRYETHAFLQKNVRQQLFDTLSLIKVQPKTILDLGASCGHSTSMLQEKFPEALVLGVDIAFNMLQEFPKKNAALLPINADFDALPFKQNTFDLIFSNLSIQWSEDLRHLWQSCYQILKPGGLLFFSTLGPDTLIELQRAWQQSEKTPWPHTFFDLHTIGDQLLQQHFFDPVMNRLTMTVAYEQAMTLLKDLKAIGANAHSEPQLWPKQRLKRLLAAYEQQRQEEQLLPATYEIIFGHAFKPMTSASALDAGQAKFSVDDLKETLPSDFGIRS